MIDVAVCQHDRVLRNVDEIVDPDHSALIVVDVQNDFAHSDGVLGAKLKQDMTHVQAALPHINQAIKNSREQGVRIIYLQEWITANTILPNFIALFGEYEETAVRDGSWGAEFVEGLEQPQGGEPIIRKPCYDGFQDTPLDVTLRSLGIRTCIYCGGATNVCVEATARHGFVKGYYTVLLDDACGAANAREHNATLDTFRIFYGPVLTVNEIGAIWKASVRAGASVTR
jgi:nicotinamidase-related amidase